MVETKKAEFIDSKVHYVIDNMEQTHSPVILYTQGLADCIGIQIALLDSAGAVKQLALYHSVSEHANYDGLTNLPTPSEPPTKPPINEAFNVRYMRECQACLVDPCYDFKQFFGYMVQQARTRSLHMQLTVIKSNGSDEDAENDQKSIKDRLDASQFKDYEFKPIIRAVGGFYGVDSGGRTYRSEEEMNEAVASQSKREVGSFFLLRWLLAVVSLFMRLISKRQAQVDSHINAPTTSRAPAAGTIPAKEPSPLRTLQGPDLTGGRASTEATDAVADSDDTKLRSK